MEISIDDELIIYIITHKDGGEMLKLFRDNDLKCDYDRRHGEYIFYDEAIYQTALLLI